MNTSLAEQISHVSIYERLGAAAGIERLTEDIVEAHMRNPVIKARFAPYRDDPERLAEIKKHVAGFFAAGTGGPAPYRGRSMPETHRGMNISEAEYIATLDDILGVLAVHGIDEETRGEVLAILYSLKGDILRA